ncbi:MAG: DUF1419 domain-containing protein [Treponema sp.]|jgi:hypothetical protein|nr:DUF1419 domain-containing protein [Treponema sp.]
MAILTEYVLKKNSEFDGIPYSILGNGVELWVGGKNRAFYETDDYSILSEAEYNEKIKAFYIEVCGKWKEITEQRYMQMLEILPPLRWDFEGFFISEAYTLDIHSYFQEFNGRYYEAYFRISTSRKKIFESLFLFINNQVLQELI